MKVFWGYASWNATQLLGEIARRGWGLVEPWQKWVFLVDQVASVGVLTCCLMSSAAKRAEPCMAVTPAVTPGSSLFAWWRKGAIKVTQVFFFSFFFFFGVRALTCAAAARSQMHIYPLNAGMKILLRGKEL